MLKRTGAYVALRADAMMEDGTLARNHLGVLLRLLITARTYYWLCKILLWYSVYSE